MYKLKYLRKNKTMLRKKLFLILILLLSTSTFLSAQAPAAWFSGGMGAFEQFLKKALTYNQLRITPLCDPALQIPTNLHVKSTVPKWVRSRVTWPEINTVTPMEKAVLEEFLFSKLHSSLTTSAQLSFFYDRDLLVHNFIRNTAQESIDENAFLWHQNRMLNTRTEIERHDLQKIADEISSNYSSLFSAEQIKGMLEEGQPLAFTLWDQGMKDFATLSLEDQRQFVKTHMEINDQQLLGLLQTNPKELSREKYNHYYIFKGRQTYLKQLYFRLQCAQQPLKSMIIRRQLALPLEFLPNPDELLTDAERLGKLYFYRDVYTQDHVLVTRAKKIESLLKKQTAAYELYAQAEMLGLPYETLLKTKKLLPHQLFSPQTLELLNNTTDADILVPLQQRIAHVVDLMAKFRQEHPNPTPADYKYYFYLETGRSKLQVAWHQAHISVSLSQAIATGSAEQIIIEKPLSIRDLMNKK